MIWREIGRLSARLAEFNSARIDRRMAGRGGIFRREDAKTRRAGHGLTIRCETTAQILNLLRLRREAHARQARPARGRGPTDEPGGRGLFAPLRLCVQTGVVGARAPGFRQGADQSAAARRVMTWSRAAFSTP
jgi:hypothetical protein